MSRFYASIQGNRGPATRQGTRPSGIEGHIRGRNIGVRVWGYVNDDGKDVFVIHKTSGSNHLTLWTRHRRDSEEIATITEE